ncbi:MAG: hypothetical protein AMXMBFR34_11150 [Myxococcaceae bacterium]
MKRLIPGVLLLSSALALASTIRAHTLADRFAASDRVALVQVVSRVTRAQGNERNLKTYTQLLIGESYKGSGPEEVTLVQLGGRLGEVESRIPGDADFAVGETALVFLHCPQAQRCYLVALGEGKLKIQGDQVLVHDLFTGAWHKRPLRALVADLKKAAAAGTEARR